MRLAAADFFAVSGGQWRSAYHVHQCVTRDRAQAERLAARMRGGATLADAFRAAEPATPADQSPWDLGWLKFQQLPVQWHGVVDRLAQGATSDVIAGPNGRFWVVQLVARKDDPAVTLESVKAEVVTHLRAQRAEAARVALPRSLEREATIERIAYPVP